MGGELRQRCVSRIHIHTHTQTLCFTFPMKQEAGLGTHWLFLVTHQTVVHVNCDISFCLCAHTVKLKKIICFVSLAKMKSHEPCTQNELTADRCFFFLNPLYHWLPCFLICEGTWQNMCKCYMHFSAQFHMALLFCQSWALGEGEFCLALLAQVWPLDHLKVEAKINPAFNPKS